MGNFDWHEFNVNMQDNGSVFDIADDFSMPNVHLGDFIPELEFELEEGE